MKPQTVSKSTIGADSACEHRAGCVRCPKRKFCPKRLRLSISGTSLCFQQSALTWLGPCSIFAHRTLRQATSVLVSRYNASQPKIKLRETRCAALPIYSKQLPQSQSLSIFVIALCLIHVLFALFLALHLPLLPHSHSSTSAVNIFTHISQSHRGMVYNNSILANIYNTSTNFQLKPSLSSKYSERSDKRHITEVVVRVPQALKGLQESHLHSESNNSDHEIVRLRNPPKPLFSAYRRISAIIKKAQSRGLIGNFPTDKRFLLYRAIGNDLPPRHGVGQVYTNVRFILDHERRYPDLDRRWYINRIVNESELARILDLLVSKNETFVLDSFDTSTYSSVDFNFDVFEHPDILRSRTFSKRSSNTIRRLVTDVIFKAKNQYIVHNNQARNAMLDLGVEAGATYILPWDGNCFLSLTAWHNITTAIETTFQSAVLLNSSAGISTIPSVAPVSLRYFYTPMQRMTDSNDFLLNPSYVPTAATEEPQLIFHRDALERFDESLSYGCGPKVELLYRLRIPGIWTSKAHDPNSCFGTANRTFSTDIPGTDSILPAGWTARLFSGVGHLEKKGANRGHYRSSGVERISALATLSVARHGRGFSPKAPLFYSVSSLQTFASNFNYYIHNDSSVPSLVSSLLNDSKNELATNLSRRSFTSAAQDAATHALAAIVASRTISLHRSRQLVLACIARDKIPDVRSSGSVCSLLDTARLLRLSGGFSFNDHKITRMWAYRHLRVLERTKSFSKAYFSTNADGVHYELMTACLAAYHGDFARVVRATGLAKSRLRVQVSGRSLWQNGFEEAVHGLVAWATLAKVAEQIGEDIWSFGTENGFGGTALLPNAIHSAVAEDLSRPHVSLQTIRTHRAISALQCIAARASSRSKKFRWPKNHRVSRRECTQSSMAYVEGGFALVPYWNLELESADKDIK